MEILDSMQQAIKKRQSASLCLIVQTDGSVPRHVGAKMIVFEDGSTQGTIGGGDVEEQVRKQALESLKNGKPQLLNYNLLDSFPDMKGTEGGSISVYIEPVLRKPRIIVIGAGHVGRAVVSLANWMGFSVIVSDDREELCTPEKIPGGERYLSVQLSKLPEMLAIDPETYLVLITRSLEIDVAGLPALLETQAAYIGLIGSKRRWESTKAALVEVGISGEKINRIKSPIGLAINAETPKEIAVSVIAEIITISNYGTRQ